ncbi:unnamed protein product, partial [Polarella glacialis]
MGSQAAKSIATGSVPSADSPSGDDPTPTASSPSSTPVLGSEDSEPAAGGASSSKSTRSSASRPSGSSQPGARQLFVLVHGICGDERDWEVWKQRLDRCERKDWDIRVSTSITAGAYFAGFEIQRLGKLLAEEVIGWVKDSLRQCAQVKLHFICHSLGGLIMRAALPQVCDAFEGMPHFVCGQILTLNTPHLGVRGANFFMC